MKNIKRILSLIIVMALLLTMMAVPAVAKDSNTNETDIIGSLYLSATPTTITVRGATSSYSFRIDDSTTWTTNATFSGLYPNTEHTVYAKLGSAPEITVGKITTKAADYVSNPNATTIDAAAPNVITLPASAISHAVSFQSSLNMNYYYSAAALAGYTNIRFYIEQQQYDKGITTCTYTKYVLDSSKYSIKDSGYGDEYVFSVKGIAAAQMGNLIHVTIYAEKDGKTYVSPVDSYSVKLYALSRLAKSSNATYKTMMVDLLNYGAAAQVYFERDVAHLVNASLTDAQKALANSTLSMSDLVDYKNTPAASKATFTGNNVLFNDIVGLRYYFTVDSSYNVSNLSVKISYTSANSKVGNVTEYYPVSSMKKSGSEYYFDVNSIPTTDMGCKVTADILYNGTSISNQKFYSIESYCKTKYSSSNDENFKAMLVALMKYSYTSRLYFK